MMLILSQTLQRLPVHIITILKFQNINISRNIEQNCQKAYTKTPIKTTSGEYANSLFYNLFSSGAHFRALILKIW